MDKEIGWLFFLLFYLLNTVAQNWRRRLLPTPVLLPGKSQGRGSLEGCSPWGRQSRTRLSDFTFIFHFHALEKEMATHSSVLAWRIPGMGEPVGLPSMGSHKVRHAEVTQWQQQQQQHRMNYLKGSFTTSLYICFLQEPVLGLRSQR